MWPLGHTWSFPDRAAGIRGPRAVGGSDFRIVQEGLGERGRARHLGGPEVVVRAEGPGPVLGPEVGRGPTVLLRVVVQRLGIPKRASPDVWIVEVFSPLQQRVVVGQAAGLSTLRAVLGEDVDQAVPVGAVQAASDGPTMPTGQPLGSRSEGNER